MKKTIAYVYTLLVPYVILLAAVILHKIIRYSKTVAASTFTDKFVVLQLYGEPILFVVTGVLLGVLAVCVMRQADKIIGRILLVNIIVLIAFYSLVWIDVAWFYTTELYAYTGMCLGVYGVLAVVTRRKKEKTAETRK